MIHYQLPSELLDIKVFVLIPYYKIFSVICLISTKNWKYQGWQLFYVVGTRVRHFCTRVEEENRQLLVTYISNGCEESQHLSSHVVTLTLVGLLFAE